MHSIIMNPQFYNYMVITARVPKAILKFNEKRIHEKAWLQGWGNKEDALKLIERFGVTEKNKRIVQDLDVMQKVTPW